MLERPALAIISCALVLMLLLVGAALAGMTLGFRDLMSLFSGAS